MRPANRPVHPVLSSASCGYHIDIALPPAEDSHNKIYTYASATQACAKRAGSEGVYTWNKQNATLHNCFVSLAFDEARNAPEETTSAVPLSLSQHAARSSCTPHIT